MAIIFANTDNYLQYVEPKDIIYIKYNNLTSEVCINTTTTKSNPINIVLSVTNAVADTILNQLESQKYSFINLSAILDSHTFGTYYINKKSIKSVLTYVDPKSKYNPKTYVELKNENQNSCIIFNQVDQEKLRLFLNSLDVKKWQIVFEKILKNKLKIGLDQLDGIVVFCL